MSGYARPSENNVSSTTTGPILLNQRVQHQQESLSCNTSVNIDSTRSSGISSSTDNRTKRAPDHIDTQQILNSNNYQIGKPDRGVIGDDSNVNGAISANNNRRAAAAELNQKNSERAVDFYSSLDRESPIDDNSWNSIATDRRTILRDCSDSTSSFPYDNTTTLHEASTSELHRADNNSRLNHHHHTTSISTDHATTTNDNHNLINVNDNNKRFLKSVPRSFQLSPLAASHSQKLPNSSAEATRLQPGDPRFQFDSLLISSDSVLVDANERELNSSGVENRPSNSFICDSSGLETTSNKSSGNSRRHDDIQRLRKEETLQDPLNESSNNESNSEEVNLDDEEEDDDEASHLETQYAEQQIGKRYRKQSSSSSRYCDDHLIDRSKSPSYFKRLQRSFGRRLFDRFSNSIFGNILTDATELDLRASSSGGGGHPYTRHQEDRDLLTGTSKYSSDKRTRKLGGGRTFRGTYKYSRAKITMAIFKRLFSLIVQRSTLSLLGAFLIHVTLGTVYTLSNINSYLTSYMRQHGSPKATYGGSMWISSSYAVGQGFSMVLGGYIEKRFSARIACFLGCALHSISIMSTSKSVDYGPLAVLMTYGFLPGFGCGLAYMTPMSNGFGWFPNRKGLVAGTILAGFGIGTFIFNMAQTAYVNPENLSPPDDANGYFTQKSILDKVPELFVFIGAIYASMQFIGCCLLFRPPNTYATATSSKSLDERPILVETEMPLKRSIRRREFIVLFVVYGITTQGVLFVNSMIKEYGQIFIGNDMYLAWTGSMASIANSAGRLVWGLAIDRFSFTQCFTSITIIFGLLMFIMPFEFILSSKLLYLLCTLGIFGSFSGWMSTYPVHLSRVFGRTNSGMIYGLIFISQSLGGIVTALGAHYLIDHYNRFVPFFCVVFLEILGLAIYHLFYPK